jgi:hypothetical protein
MVHTVDLYATPLEHTVDVLPHMAFSTKKVPSRRQFGDVPKIPRQETAYRDFTLNNDFPISC